MLLFVDSFAHYNTAQFGQKWVDTGIMFGLGGSGAIVAGRHTGSFALQTPHRFYQGSTQQPGCYRILPGNYQTVIAGCALRPDNISGIVTPPTVYSSVFGFWDGISNASQISLQIDSSGKLYLVAGYGTTLADSGSNVLTTGVWYFVEMKVTINSTGGAAEVRVQTPGSFKTVTWITFTGNTRGGTGNNYANVFAIGKINGGSFLDALNSPSLSYGDLYLAEGGSGLVTDFVGNSRVALMTPNSTVQAQWSKQGAASNDAAVASNPFVSSKFVFDSNPGDQDLYGFTALPSSDAVKGVQAVYAGYKDSTATRKTQVTVKSSGSSSSEDALDASGAATMPLSTAQFHEGVFETDPNTSAAWTPSAVNAVQSGPLVVS